MMKLTLLVKLAPGDEQYSLLLHTMERFNEARTREQYGLSAQMTVRAIGKVVEAYKRDKRAQHVTHLQGQALPLRGGVVGLKAN